MGSAACMHLARRGCKVVGLEQHGLGHALGSSHGQTRLIRKAYFEHPDYVPLLHRAYALWDDLGARIGRPLLHRSGLVMVGPPDEPKDGQDLGVVAGARQAAREHGLDLRTLTSIELSTLAPGLRLLPGHEAVLEPEGGWLDVEACVLAHAELARQAGAVIVDHCRVHGWSAGDGGIEVEIDQGLIRARKLVLTTGAWAGPFLAGLGIRLSVHRNVLGWFAADDLWRADRGAPCFAFDLPEGFFYGFPALDERGLKLAEHRPGEPVADPDHVDRTLRPDDVAPLHHCLGQVLTGVRPELRHHATCLYEMSPDGHFLVDTLAEDPNVVVAAGFSGHGFKFASVMGEILADLALDGGTRHPIHLFGLDRPGLRLPGLGRDDLER